MNEAKKFQINSLVFREYDIRGIASVDLSGAFAKSLGLAYAQYIRKNNPVAGRSKLTVAVGKDCRLSSDGYEEALVEGLLSGGLDVIRLGLCPTPLTYFSLFHLDLDGGIMVTASHNPPNHNGFKVCVGRESIFGNQIQELRSLMEKGSVSVQPNGSLSNFDIIKAYIDYQKKQFSHLMGKKIVIDCGNGMASVVASKLFRSLGVEVLELYCELDGTFPNHIPDPTVASNLVDLIKAVKESHADFGVGFDGDADRIGVVDENGRLLSGDELMVIFSRVILAENPGSTIISEVKSSFRLFDDIREKGGLPLMWKVGHSHLKAKIKETGALLGGELSGHVCFADRYFGFDDAIYAALRLLEIALRNPEPLSSFLKDLPVSFSTPELRLPFEDNLKFQLVDNVKSVLLNNSSLDNSHVTDIDGIRIDFGDGWGLIRASNTQPVLTFRFEASSKNRLSEIKSIFESAANDACQKMNHSPIRMG
jgi:phosphomannomutase/phosphoglucomutase